MLTGRKTGYFQENNNPLFSSSQDLSSLPQTDTIRQVTAPQVQISTPQKATTSYTNAQLDSLFKLSERREQQIVLATKMPLVPKKELNLLPADTIATRYHKYNFPFSTPKPVVLENTHNFLLNIPYKTYTHQLQLPSVINTPEKPVNGSTIKIIDKQALTPNYLNGTVRYETGMNWLIITLLVSLFTFSWMRIVYEKFIVQIIGSVINYQISVRLLRERNVLFKNLSFGLNFIFAMNLGLFLFYFIDYSGYNQILTYKFLSMFIYTIGILTIYTIKSAFCKFLGYIFLVQEEFDEYIHNVNLFNKNIGLFLFPVVIVYPFISEPVKPYILYIGFAIISILFILRVHRGFQIIMKKGVSIFYLILYLCAVEILPVLLIIKFAVSLI